MFSLETFSAPLVREGRDEGVRGGEAGKGRRGGGRKGKGKDKEKTRRESEAELGIPRPRLSIESFGSGIISDS